MRADRYWIAYLGGIAATLLFALGLVLSQAHARAQELLGLQLVAFGCVVSVGTLLLFWLLPKRT